METVYPGRPGSRRGLRTCAVWQAPATHANNLRYAHHRHVLRFLSTNGITPHQGRRGFITRMKHDVVTGTQWDTFTLV
jgi:hypothetical protein